MRIHGMVRCLPSVTLVLTLVTSLVSEPNFPQVTSVASVVYEPGLVVRGFVGNMYIYT